MCLYHVLLHLSSAGSGSPSRPNGTVHSGGRFLRRPLGLLLRSCMLWSGRGEYSENNRLSEPSFHKSANCRISQNSQAARYGYTPHKFAPAYFFDDVVYFSWSHVIYLLVSISDVSLAVGQPHGSLVVSDASLKDVGKSGHSLPTKKQITNRVRVKIWNPIPPVREITRCYDKTPNHCWMEAPWPPRGQDIDRPEGPDS